MGRQLVQGHRHSARRVGRTVEAVLDLGFGRHVPGFRCEGLVHTPEGTPVMGIHPRNRCMRVGDPVRTDLGDPATAGSASQYVPGRMDQAVFDDNVFPLIIHLEAFGEMMPEPPTGSARRCEILRTIGRALDALDLQDIAGTAPTAREILFRPVHSVPAGHARRDRCGSCRPSR
ncbi:hypothetical protein [Streptomyces sp. NRRL F-5630]|uniref:hypothetical protein n=1 Tax=Streptomyces sp. NRRL F-5630 TaxID=1463864 RepID=UPI0004C56FD1